MSRYFFDTHDGTRLTRDIDGSDLPNREAAQREAHLVLRLMAKDEMLTGDARNLYVNVRDEAGVPIYTVNMMMAGHWLS